MARDNKLVSTLHELRASIDAYLLDDNVDIADAVWLDEKVSESAYEIHSHVNRILGIDIPSSHE